MVTIAVLASVYPVIALLLDFVLYGQTLGPLQSLGVALIVLGTLGVNLKWGGSWRAVTAEAEA